MNLTDHTDLGLRALLCLGATPKDRLSARDISTMLGVSYTHIQKVVQSLQTGGFVLTFRGKHGGIQLARATNQIRVGEVVRALEPNLAIVECLRSTKAVCTLAGGCALSRTIRRARDAMLAELDRDTIADIVQGSAAVRQIVAAHYQGG